MARELVTRDSLRRELLLNAAGKPLAAEMEQIAARAQIVAGFLDGHAPAALHVRLRELQQAGRQGEEPAVRARERAAAAVEAQLRIGEALDSELDRFTAEMEHLIAS